jgi:hypothetical protein
MTRNAGSYFTGYGLMLIGFGMLAGFSTLLPNEAYGPGVATPAEAAVARISRADRFGAGMTIETFNAIHSARLPERETESPAADAPQAAITLLEPQVRLVRGLDSHMPTPDFSAPSVEDRNRMMVENARLEQLSGQPGTITNPGVPDFDRMARDLNRVLQGGTRQSRATPRPAPL